MNEYIQGMFWILGVINCAVFAFITMLGGRPNGRILKRVIAPIIFCSGVILLSLLTHHFNWWFLTSIPAYLISCNLGYGGNSLWEKISRRTIWSILRTLASLTFALFTGTWLLFILQCISSLVITLVLGVINPLNAPAEEGTINFISVLFVPLYVL